MSIVLHFYQQTLTSKHLSELPQTLQLHKDMPDHYSLYLNSAFKQAFQVVLGKRPQAKNTLQSLVILMGLKVTQLLRKITFYNILFTSSVSFNPSWWKVETTNHKIAQLHLVAVHATTHTHTYVRTQSNWLLACEVFRSNSYSN